MEPWDSAPYKNASIMSIYTTLHPMRTYRPLQKRTTFELYTFLPDLSQHVKKASRIVTTLN
jgi:hypothetical protein